MKRSDTGKRPAASQEKDPMLGQLVAEKWRVVERLADVGRDHAYKAERLPSGETVRIDLPSETPVHAR
ncbi:MAG TPA: hypothetical protein VHU40_08405, partial [Polyangia bacterium]|nr:hypothetical protein [Polyangia bacterium]